MIRILISTMCMAGTLVLAASCNKIEENVTSDEVNGRTVISAVAEAVGGGAKAHNQYCYDVLWDKGDRIYVVGEKNSNTFTVSDESAGTYGRIGHVDLFQIVKLHNSMSREGSKTDMLQPPTSVSSWQLKERIFIDKQP